MRRWAIVVHGGAGTIRRESMDAEREQAHRDALNAALDAAARLLADGASAVDAVEAAVRVLEDAPLFNAGRGSVLTHDGTVEMDAAIMRGSDHAAGAVAGVHGARNPISAARAVLERSPHVLLVGAGADTFIAREGLPTEPETYFKTDYREQQWRAVADTDTIQLDHADELRANEKFGTVGAVALDVHGHVAAATSTGGMTNKQWGRVGDSPLIGAGTYADDATCAVSCTGHGEYFIREAAAFSVSARMRFAGQSLEDAAQATIHEDLAPREGLGGVIAVDAAGHVAMPFSTLGMFRGFRHSDGRAQVAIWA